MLKQSSSFIRYCLFTGNTDCTKDTIQLTIPLFVNVLSYMNFGYTNYFKFCICILIHVKQKFTYTFNTYIVI